MTTAITFQPHWSRQMAQPLRGLVLAREKGRLLAWDENDWIYLFDQTGNLQGQVHPPNRVTAACGADDGTAYVACGARGEVWWLTPDLMTAWEHALPQRAIVAALDPFGQYLAVADAGGGLHVIDRHARPVFQVQSPRPLYHLAFVPAAPYLLACSDYGLVACLDLTGRWVWRDGLVAHIGALAVSGDGGRIVLACYTEGLQGYTLDGKRQMRQAVAEPCRLTAVTFDGRLTLVAGLSDRLQMLDADGGLAGSYTCASPPAALTLGAVGDEAVAALADGTLVGLRVSA